MSTEFTRLNHAIITPVMRTKGFRKIGKYDYGATFDKAVYQSSDKEFHVIFSVHPYDYPYHGIRIEEISDSKVVSRKEYLLEDGSLEYLMHLLARDLDEGKFCI